MQPGKSTQSLAEEHDQSRSTQPPRKNDQQHSSIYKGREVRSAPREMSRLKRDAPSSKEKSIHKDHNRKPTLQQRTAMIWGSFNSYPMDNTQQLMMEASNSKECPKMSNRATEEMPLLTRFANNCLLR